MNRSIEPLSDATLERFVLEELDETRMEEVRRRCDSDPAIRIRIESMRESNRLILETHPAPEMAKAIRARRNSEADRSGPVMSPTARKARKAATRMEWLSMFLHPRFAAPVLAVIILGLFLAERPDRVGNGSGSGDPDGTLKVTVPDEIHLKGAESGLAVFRKTPAGSELLTPQSAARPGDTLQVFYHSRKDAFGLVFSVDGAGSITLHYPEQEGAAAPLESGSLHPLPHAFRLDKAPRFERFFLITSPQPFSTVSLLERIRAQARADSLADTLSGLAEGFRQYSYTVRKEEPASRGPQGSRKVAGK